MEFFYNGGVNICSYECCVSVEGIFVFVVIYILFFVKLFLIMEKELKWRKFNWSELELMVLVEVVVLYF